jgi:hypothetical protein
MYMVIEQWSYKPAWKALSTAERQAFVEGVGGAVAELAKAGITTLGFGINDVNTDHRSTYDFWAVWQCPDVSGARAFQDAVAGSGWYNLFEHKNMVGLVQDPPSILGQHIAAV